MRKIFVSAGDVITAKLIEQAGFGGIWLSGFECSARLGLADNGSLTLTEMLNIARPIVEAVKIPVMVDTDTGYGNFQRTVREFERIGVDTICVEDNVEGLKVNSLWGQQIPLMKMEDFGRKIQVKRSKIKVMARTEALIRNYGEMEAVKRLAHYQACGADILLPHVRDEKDILWIGKSEFEYAIVPTKFPYYTNDKLFDMGYSYVIWANQTERVKIKSIRDALGMLKEKDCSQEIEDNLSASLDDLKGLTPDD